MRLRASALMALLVALGGFGVLGASQDAPAVEIAGEVRAFTLTRPGDPTSGATVVVGADRVTIPGDVALDLPATVMSPSEVFAQAPPACRARGESGFAATDRCRAEVGAGAADGPSNSRSESRQDPSQASADSTAPIAKATITARREADGRLVALAVELTKNVEEFWGGVTFVNEADGYVRVNGVLRQDEGGTLLRLNDPFKQQSDQRGEACGSEGNCSPDVRFRLDSARLSVRFERGNPACIGGEAQACPAANRGVSPEDTVSRVPIVVGDNVKAEGAYEIAGGVRFFSAQSLVVQTTLAADR